MSYKTYARDLKDEKIERLMTALRKISHCAYDVTSEGMKGACHPEGCESPGIAIRALLREGDKEWEGVWVYGD